MPLEELRRRLEHAVEEASMSWVVAGSRLVALAPELLACLEELETMRTDAEALIDVFAEGFDLSSAALDE